MEWSLELIEDLDILKVLVEPLEAESFLEELICESWLGFLVTVHEFLLLKIRYIFLEINDQVFFSKKYAFDSNYRWVVTRKSSQHSQTSSSRNDSASSGSTNTFRLFRSSMSYNEHSLKIWTFWKCWLNRSRLKRSWLSSFVNLDKVFWWLSQEFLLLKTNKMFWKIIECKKWQLTKILN